MPELTAAMETSGELLPQAEVYHQQYLYEVPNGYCGIGGANVNAGGPSA
ncbi:hypothetical protein ACOZ38_02760 [Sphaerisporangium viridialbum]